MDMTSPETHLERSRTMYREIKTVYPGNLLVCIATRTSRKDGNLTVNKMKTALDRQV